MPTSFNPPIEIGYHIASYLPPRLVAPLALPLVRRLLRPLVGEVSSSVSHPWSSLGSWYAESNEFQLQHALLYPLFASSALALGVRVLSSDRALLVGLALRDLGWPSKLYIAPN